MVKELQPLEYKMIYYPDSLGGLPTEIMLMYCTLSCVIGISINICLNRVLRGTMYGIVKHNCPLWSFYLCILYQSVIFPVMIFLSIEECESLEDHFMMTWEEGNTKTINWLRGTYLVLLSYLIKDVLYCTPLQQVHHISGFWFLMYFLVVPRGINAFVTGCVCLEYGNAFLNISVLKNQRLHYKIALVAFTCVHIPGAYCIYRTIQDQQGDENTMFFRFIALASVIVLVMREREVICNFLESN